MLNKEVSSTIAWVFGIEQPGIEPQSPRPLLNTLTTRPMYENLNTINQQTELTASATEKNIDIIYITREN